MSVVAIWGVAALAYLGFRLWYGGLGKPLTADEIAHISQVLENRVGEDLDADDVATIRIFMEEDDGKEFVMVNLVEFNASPVKHPDTSTSGIGAAARFQLVSTSRSASGHTSCEASAEFQ